MWPWGWAALDGSAGGDMIISGYNMQVLLKFGSIKIHPFIYMHEKMAEGNRINSRRESCSAVIWTMVSGWSWVLTSQVVDLGQDVSTFHFPVQFLMQSTSWRMTSDCQRNSTYWLKSFLQTRLVCLNDLQTAQDTGLFMNNQCFQRPQIANYWNNDMEILKRKKSILHGLSWSKSVG